MGQQFTETAHKDGDGLRVVSIAQTRGGVQEWITPTALWELDDATGLYLPPGESENPRRPRVEATLSGSMWETVTLVNALAVTDTTTRNVKVTDHLSKYERIAFVVNNALGVSVDVWLSATFGSNPWEKADGTDLFPHLTVSPGNAFARVLITDSDTGWELLNQGLNQGYVEYKAASAPASGAISIWLVGLKKGLVAS